MLLNRELIDRIKEHFAGKSSSQLRDIMAQQPGRRWSFEAHVAAEEVLEERKDGLAQEPLLPTKIPLPKITQVPEELIDGEISDDQQDPLFPKITYVPEELIDGLILGFLIGYLFVPYFRRRDFPSFSMPFGKNMAWFAIDTRDQHAVATAFQLQDTTRCVWEKGIEAAHNNQVFVTPPVGDWILVPSTSLYLMPGKLTMLLEQLSSQFSDVQYFCHQEEIELYVWARAKNGTIERAFGWLGKQSTTLMDVGEPDEDEQSLGIVIEDGQPRYYDDRKRTTIPFQAEDLFELANQWSINPELLDVRMMDEMIGIVGNSDHSNQLRV